jgi:hypothetical protein
MDPIQTALDQVAEQLEKRGASDLASEIDAAGEAGGKGSKGPSKGTNKMPAGMILISADTGNEIDRMEDACKFLGGHLAWCQYPGGFGAYEVVVSKKKLTADVVAQALSDYYGEDIAAKAGKGGVKVSF